MKSSKGRAALCWILAVLSIPVGIVLTSVLYALIPGENTALRLYLFNIPSEIFCFALPAFFILAARPERLARFRATKRGLYCPAGRISHHRCIHDRGDMGRSA